MFCMRNSTSLNSPYNTWLKTYSMLGKPGLTIPTFKIKSGSATLVTKLGRLAASKLGGFPLSGKLGRLPLSITLFPFAQKQLLNLLKWFPFSFQQISVFVISSASIHSHKIHIWISWSSVFLSNFYWYHNTGISFSCRHSMFLKLIQLKIYFYS